MDAQSPRNALELLEFYASDVDNAALHTVEAVCPQKKEHEGIGGLLALLAIGTAIDRGFQSKPSDEAPRTSVFQDVPFQDFRNAWGSNNDHNWEADGDVKWDSYE